MTPEAKKSPKPMVSGFSIRGRVSPFPWVADTFKATVHGWAILHIYQGLFATVLWL